VPDEVREGSRILRRGELYRRALDQRGGQGNRWKRRGQRQISRGAQEGRGFRCAARTDQARRLRQPDPEYLRPEGREERRRALEYGDSHLPQRLAILEVQTRGVLETTRLRSELSSVQILLAVRLRM